MFLWGNFVLFAAHDLLSVVDQVDRKKESDQGRVDCVHNRIVAGKEYNGQNTKDEEDPSSRKQVNP